MPGRINNDLSAGVITQRKKAACRAAFFIPSCIIVCPHTFTSGRNRTVALFILMKADYFLGILMACNLLFINVNNL